MLGAVLVITGRSAARGLLPVPARALLPHALAVALPRGAARGILIARVPPRPAVPLASRGQRLWPRERRGATGVGRWPQAFRAGPGQRRHVERLAVRRPACGRWQPVSVDAAKRSLRRGAKDVVAGIGVSQPAAPRRGRREAVRRLSRARRLFVSARARAVPLRTRQRRPEQLPVEQAAHAREDAAVRVSQWLPSAAP